MRIWLARIPEEGSNFEGDESGTILDVENDPQIGEAGDIHYDLYAQHVSGELVVRGILCAQLVLRCARCAEFFSTTVAVSDFLRAYSAPEGTDAIDIDEELREEILLHVPPFALCSEECKGVCAHCGADLNKGTCGCKTDDRAAIWSALDGLDL